MSKISNTRCPHFRGSEYQSSTVNEIPLQQAVVTEDPDLCPLLQKGVWPHKTTPRLGQQEMESFMLMQRK